MYAIRSYYDEDGNDSVTVAGDGSVDIEVPCHGGKILVPQG